jgi:hypothetical protein
MLGVAGLIVGYLFRQGMGSSCHASSYCEYGKVWSCSAEILPFKSAPPQTRNIQKI